MSTMGDAQYREGYHDPREEYHDARGGYHEYHGGCSVPLGDNNLCNSRTVGEYHDTCGGIISTVGVFSTRGYSYNKRFFPHIIVFMISPT